MQEIVWLLRNGCDFEKASKTFLDDRSFFLEMPKTHPKPEEKKENASNVIKTHIKYDIIAEAIQRGNPKVIVVVRNPKDVLVSEFHFYRMNESFGNFSGSWDEYFEMFKNKELNYGYWYDHVLGWWENSQKLDIKFVKYEDMKRNPLKVVSDIAAYLQVSPTNTQISDIIQYTQFDKMKDNKMVNKVNWNSFDQSVSKFIRKGTVGDWKNHFNESQSDFMDALCKNLEDKGLSLNCE